jgi:hypothetical protein
MLNMGLVLSVCYLFNSVWITMQHSLNGFSALSSSLLMYINRIHNFYEVLIYKFSAAIYGTCVELCGQDVK